MNFTNILQLPCPESTDYALLPIYMQRLALQIEALLVKQQTDLATFENQPTAVWQSTSSFTFTTTGVLSTNLFASQLLFSNYSCAAAAGPALPEFSESTTVLFPSAGVYHLGFHVVGMVATGAVTNDSNRSVQLQVQK